MNIEQAEEIILTDEVPFRPRESVVQMGVLAVLWGGCLAWATSIILAGIWLAFSLSAMSAARMPYFADNVDGSIRRPKRILEIGTAFLWGLAPLMIWQTGIPHFRTIAVIILCTGFLQVIHKYQDRPRPAIIVTIPYALLCAWFLYQARLSSEWFVGIIGVLALIATISGFLHSGYKLRRSIEIYAEDQAKLRQELQFERMKADKANHAKSRFLANMSHELRTPLNGIIGLTDLLLKETDDAKQKRQLSLVEDSGQTLLSLLNDILDLSKIEAGELEINPIEVDLHEFIQKIYGFWEVSASAKSVSLDFRLHRELDKRLVVDPTRLRQCIDNLISNALKFTSECGKITVSVSAKAARGGRMLTVAVVDTGIGMTEEQLGMLFQPFKQADIDIARRFGGTGLGLTISMQLSKKMGGDISVSSASGSGSTFILTVLGQKPGNNFSVRTLDEQEREQARSEDRDAQSAKKDALIRAGLLDPESGKKLPRLSDSKPPMPSELPANLSPKTLEYIEEIRGLKLLLVEDNARNMEIMLMLCEPFGMDITAVHNGYQALEVLNSDPGIDIVLMDTDLAGLDGFETTERIRMINKRIRSVPVVAIIDSPLPDTVEKCRDIGMDGYITRPLSRTSLARTLAQTLSANAEKYDISA